MISEYGFRSFDRSKNLWWKMQASLELYKRAIEEGISQDEINELEKSFFKDASAWRADFLKNSSSWCPKVIEPVNN